MTATMIGIFNPSYGSVVILADTETWIDFSCGASHPNPQTAFFHCVRSALPSGVVALSVVDLHFSIFSVCPLTVTSISRGASSHDPLHQHVDACVSSSPHLCS